MKEVGKLSVVAFMFLIALNINGQEKISKTYTFDGKKKKETVRMKLSNDNIKSIIMNISSKIKGGFVSVEIVDPNSNIKDSFVLFSANRTMHLAKSITNKLKEMKDTGNSNLKWKRVKNGLIIDSIKIGSSNSKWKPVKSGLVIDSAKVGKFKLIGKEGEIRKVIKKPIKGRWMVILKTQKAKGTVTLSFDIDTKE